MYEYLEDRMDKYRKKIKEKNTNNFGDAENPL